MGDREYVVMNDQGRIVIPATIRKQLGLHAGSCLVAHIDRGYLVLMPEEAIKARLWAMFDGLGFSMADELMQERTMEAAAENKR